MKSEIQAILILTVDGLRDWAETPSALDPERRSTFQFAD